MKNFKELVNDYENGCGRLFKYTADREDKNGIINQFEKLDISYLMSEDSCKKAVFYFGDSNSLESLRILLGLNLGWLGFDSKSVIEAMIINDKDGGCRSPFDTTDGGGDEAGLHVLRAG